MEHDRFGDRQLKELKKGGSDIQVTEINKNDYVRLYVLHRFMQGIERQFAALQKGLNEVVPQHLLLSFDERELELVIGGLGKIDIDDWKRNTRLKVKVELEANVLISIQQFLMNFFFMFSWNKFNKNTIKHHAYSAIYRLLYSNFYVNIHTFIHLYYSQHCNPETPVVGWFWKIVDSYSEEMRARLLQFVTGSSRVPLQGFKALQGSTGAAGPRLFTIHVVDAPTGNILLSCLL